jgi:hypothetical protein
MNNWVLVVLGKYCKEEACDQKKKKETKRWQFS